mmetsp:Transcript_86453/g.258039  ORF Transcript_86453/g.258039 Transcript_86453/m.258039 type:complete len:155 (-) Transcript_86453:47-511(-)
MLVANKALGGSGTLEDVEKLMALASEIRVAAAARPAKPTAVALQSALQRKTALERTLSSQASEQARLSDKLQKQKTAVQTTAEELSDFEQDISALQRDLKKELAPANHTVPIVEAPVITELPAVKEAIPVGLHKAYDAFQATRTELDTALDSFR